MTQIFIWDFVADTIMGNLMDWFYGQIVGFLAYCNLLFKIEETLVDLPQKERYNQWLEQAKPVLAALLVWANTSTAMPKSSLGKALSYLKEQWPYVLNYPKDGRLELSNNRAECSIKPFCH